MEKPKITIEQIKNYLGTDLNGLIIYPDSSEKCTLKISSGLNNRISLDEFLNSTYQVKPVCYRMSDLDKFIPELGFVPARELAKLITQAGWNADKIQTIKNEDDTITCVWPIRTLQHPEAKNSISYQNFFEIDTDADFGFGIYYKKITSKGTVEEIESNTGNIWAMCQKLFEWHFWPFGEAHFTEGLIIDKLAEGKGVGNEK